MLTLIDPVCVAAAQQGAEDVFFKTGHAPYARVEGQIRPMAEEALTHEELARFWQACGANPDFPHEVDASWAASSGHRFRVNLFRQLGSLAAALRPIKTQIPALDSLGAPVARLQSWASRTSGILLITGSTGAGKSTTIAALLDWINHHRSQHIVTIEDPIEFLLQPARCIVTQREVGSDTESFATGLRSSLRQSPDVILVGEIRDAETAKIALQASETGHLVLSTLHTADVAETFERLLALFPASERQNALMVLGGQLIGILSQKLVPTLDGGLRLLCEHLENSGAVSRWALRGEFGEISEFMKRESDRENVRFIDSILEAHRAGAIGEEVARSACPDPSEFDQRQAGLHNAG